MSDRGVQSADVVIIGAGAAGLMAGIFAARTNAQRRIVILDGAARLGAKILVSGGGRCNITHDVITPNDFDGSSRHAIRNVLRRFDVAETVAFFQDDLGVTLKREPETGKIFPVTDDARTVLDALLDAMRQAGVEIIHPWRVASIEPSHESAARFILQSETGETFIADRIILATGGMSLPKTGSDGFGYRLAKSLRHRLSHHILPGLVPLTLPNDHFITRLKGVTVDPAALEVCEFRTGKRLQRTTGSLLCTHFGLSGPCALDMSRHYLSAKAVEHPDNPVELLINWSPTSSISELDQSLQARSAVHILSIVRRFIPLERLARALLEHASVPCDLPVSQLSREKRQGLIRTMTALPLPVIGHRGFNYAEVTAGGIPLADINIRTMESRLTPGLFFCGEICDVDGRIGGFNFQWAWSSGYVAGVSV